LSTFSAWDIDDAGDTGKTWRIYEGNTYPLLRHFLPTATATADNTSMVYNGSTTVAGGSYTWDIAVDAGKVFGAAAYTASSKDVGNRALSLTGLYSNQQGYDIKTVDGTVDITQKDLTASYTGTDKVYDATTNATVTGSSGDIIGGDAVTFSETASFIDKNAGIGKTINVTGITLGGADAGNYSLLNTTAATTADITKAALTVTAQANTKVYDATTSAAATPIVAGLKGSDTVTGLAEAYDTKDAGTGKTLSVSTYTVNDGNAGNNYTVTTVNDTTGVVTAKGLTASYTGTDKVYDATTAATVTGSSGDIIGGDTVTFSETASFIDKNAGINKTINVTGITLGGADAGNYSLLNATATTTADITKKGLTLSGITASNKVYDATTAATVNTGSAVYTGLIGGDAVTVSATGIFDTKNVGTGKTVNLTSSYAGADAGNYSITDQATTTADITKAVLSITAQTNTKTYDATTSATATPIVAGLKGSDTVTGLAEAYDTKNAGTGKTLSVSTYTVNDGNAGNNYTVTTVNDTTGVIAQKDLTASYTGTSKVYDATTNATVTGSSGDIIVGDAVTFSETASFIDKNAGIGKTINVTGITLGGADSGNYSLLNTTATTTADITKAVLSITANNDNRIYSGVPYSGGNGVTYAGFAGGETQAVLGGTLQYGGTSQGAINMGTYGIDPSGLTSGNYAISFASGVLTIGGSSWTSMESVNSVLTCTLNTSNGTATLPGALNTTGGTQEGQGGYPGTHDILFMGPGTGGTTLTNFINTTLVGP